MVSARLNEDHLEAVEVIQRALGVSRSDAIREAVVWLADVLSAPTPNDAKKALAARMERMETAEPAESKVSDDLAERLVDALNARERAYTDMSHQLQRIGNNWNQMVRLSHAGHPVDADAVTYVGRSLESALGRLDGLTRADDAVRKEVDSCLS
ncbi:ribbon-helix-helix protein, CopG family [Micrococcus antarcticus]|uniref:ribbon-helix-helix protein, CopG family n=1 Tax=Micrococcus antarcticus TaxID=86171 RepID=UPI003850AEF5